MNNLLIGDTSQLAKYFPENFEKVSSRNIDFKKISEKKYKSIHILFAEQRTFLNENEKFFKDVNVDYTLNVIDKIKNFTDEIKIYSTSELWNNCSGEISVDTKFDYNYSPYIKSKEIISNIINEKKEEYYNVNIVYPFNFNSPYRKNGFLFSKIFDSIINKNKNTIGYVDFDRDIIHPSIIVRESIKSKKDIVIGSGELVNVLNFIKDLFKLGNLDFNDYILVDEIMNLNQKRNLYFSKTKFSNYNELLNLTTEDVRNYKISKRHN